MICSICNKLTQKNKFDEADGMCISCQDKTEYCKKCQHPFLNDGTEFCEDCKEDDENIMINKNVLEYTIKMQKMAFLELSQIKEKSVTKKMEMNRLNACIGEFERYMEVNYKEGN